MAIINTGLLTKGLRSDFFDHFERTPNHYKDLATRVVSNADREDYRWLGTVPRIREWDQGRLAQGLRTESYSVENLKYEATIEVDRDEVSDDQTGQIRMRIAELAQRAATHKDYLISQLLTGGETAGNNSYDGVSFFNTTHASGASGNQSNLLTYDAEVTDAPTVDGSGRGKREHQTSLSGQGGRAISDEPDRPCASSFTASEAINARSSSSTKTVGPSRHPPAMADGQVEVVPARDGRRRRPFIFRTASRSGSPGWIQTKVSGEVPVWRTGATGWPAATAVRGADGLHCDSPEGLPGRAAWAGDGVT
jgi:hypothetical protein